MRASESGWGWALVSHEPLVGCGGKGGGRGARRARARNTTTLHPIKDSPRTPHAHKIYSRASEPTRRRGTHGDGPTMRHVQHSPSSHAAAPPTRGTHTTRRAAGTDAGAGERDNRVMQPPLLLRAHACRIASAARPPRSFCHRDGRNERVELHHVGDHPHEPAAAHSQPDQQR